MQACARVGALVLVGCGLLLTAGCPTPVESNAFESISELGFGKQDNAQDLNNYPWAMFHFTPDGSDTGYIYVGTGNSVINAILQRINVNLSINPVFRTPEIRRFRPDLGPKSWERVLDYRDIEDPADPLTTGFRAMNTYSPVGDDATYLYAGTIGDQVALWRTATGEPGSWERVWLLEKPGSIRSLVEHNGILYIAVSHEFEQPPTPPGELYATDGTSLWLVNNDGFGNATNVAFFEMASFNDWLYVGTLNREDGFEVWKLLGPDGQDAPRPVITGGGSSRSNMGVSMMREFQDHLYISTLIFVGANTESDGMRGADMVRIDRADNMDVIVGPTSLSGFKSGFDRPTNTYLWSLVVHQGKLYCGTWDANAFLPILGYYLRDIFNSKDLILQKPAPDLYDRLTNKGAELWVTEDGVNWSPVFTNGLGNPDHYGVRNMLSVGETLILGMANPLDGLEIFRSKPGSLE
jgi:hypothetical protein